MGLPSYNDFAWIDSADGEGLSILAFDAIETRSFGPYDGSAFLEFLSSFSCQQTATSSQQQHPSLWLCYISYEAFRFNPLIPFKPTHKKNYPFAVFRRYASFVKINHHKKQAPVVAGPARGPKPTEAASPPRCLVSRAEYDQAIASIKTKLFDGDYYELNYTMEFAGQFKSAAIDLYLRLRDIAQAPMMAFFDWPEVKILSASPERFFKIEGGLITTNPIKGTIKRGATDDEDEQNKKTLSSSEKDCVELLMVTDMLRNDIGRVCEIGSVKVDNLFGLHTFSHYHHLISDIVGRLKKETTLADIFCALFPGGSITGAPKIAVMKHIDELEHRARGVYTGAIGYIADTGVMDFNIPIRTITIEGDRLSFAVGGGIVADSIIEKEYEECLIKAQGLLRAISDKEDIMP